MEKDIIFEIEQNLLGTLILKNELLTEVDERLKPEHFSVIEHEKIFEAIQKITSNKQEADPFTITTLLLNCQDLKHINLQKYIVDICAGTLHFRGTKTYSENIIEDFLKRSIKDIAKNIYNDVFLEENTTATDIIFKIEKELEKLKEYQKIDSIKHIKDIAKEYVENYENPYFDSVSTGFKSLDDIMGGFKNGTLNIIGARPGIGKTAFALNIANNIGNNKNILIFSLEMPGYQLVERLFAIQNEWNLSHLAMRKKKADDFVYKKEYLSKTLFKIENLNIWIDETPSITIQKIKNLSKIAYKKNNIDIIIIDHLHLVTDQSTKNKYEQLSYITAQLKILSKELDIPVIALAQLSRESERRDNKKPQLADLRESGTIEQDADVVIGLHREEYYLEREEPQQGTIKHAEWQQEMTKNRNKIDVICLKNRQGKTFTKNLGFETQTNKIFELDVCN